MKGVVFIGASIALNILTAHADNHYKDNGNLIDGPDPFWEMKYYTSPTLEIQHNQRQPRGLISIWQTQDEKGETACQDIEKNKGIEYIKTSQVIYNLPYIPVTGKQIVGWRLFDQAGCKGKLLKTLGIDDRSYYGDEGEFRWNTKLPPPTRDEALAYIKSLGSTVSQDYSARDDSTKEELVGQENNIEGPGDGYIYNVNPKVMNYLDLEKKVQYLQDTYDSGRPIQHVLSFAPIFTEDSNVGNNVGAAYRGIVKHEDEDEPAADTLQYGLETRINPSFVFVYKEKFVHYSDVYEGDPEFDRVSLPLEDIMKLDSQPNPNIAFSAGQMSKDMYQSLMNTFLDGICLSMPDDVAYITEMALLEWAYKSEAPPEYRQVIGFYFYSAYECEEKTDIFYLGPGDSTFDENTYERRWKVPLQQGDNPAPWKVKSIKFVLKDGNADTIVKPVDYDLTYERRLFYSAPWSLDYIRENGQEVKRLA